MERFARFLARHYYHERLTHFFKYSTALARATGRRPDALLRSPAFDALLPRLVLGSRESAREVAALAAAHVAAGGTDAIPYLEELLRYESAMLVAEAGPRVWRDDPAVGGGGEGAATRDESAILLQLSWDLPAVFPRLLGSWSEVPAAVRAPITLIVARSKHGRVSVARANAAASALVELADGRRSLEELAREAGLRPAEAEATLVGLAELGAVRFGTGS